MTEVAVLNLLPRPSLYLVAVACLSIGLASTCAAQSDSLSLSQSQNPTAGFVSLNVILTASPGAQPAAIQWTLNYPASTVVGLVAAVGPAASTAGKMVTCASNLCLLYGLDSRAIQNGVVAVLTFQLAGSPSSQIAFQLEDALAASPEADQMSVSTSSRIDLRHSPIGISAQR